MEFNIPLEFSSEMLFKKEKDNSDDAILRKLLNNDDEEELDYEVRIVKVTIGGFDSLHEAKESNKCYLNYLNDQFLVLEPYEQLKERIKKLI